MINKLINLLPRIADKSCKYVNNLFLLQKTQSRKIRNCINIFKILTTQPEQHHLAHLQMSLANLILPNQTSPR